MDSRATSKVADTAAPPCGGDRRRRMRRMAKAEWTACTVLVLVASWHGCSRVRAQSQAELLDLTSSYWIEQALSGLVKLTNGSQAGTGAAVEMSWGYRMLDPQRQYNPFACTDRSTVMYCAPPCGSDLLKGTVECDPETDDCESCGGACKEDESIETGWGIKFPKRCLRAIEAVEDLWTPLYVDLYLPSLSGPVIASRCLFVSSCARSGVYIVHQKFSYHTVGHR